MTAGSETTVEEYLRQFRHVGWKVAVHNDYDLNGRAFTFWLFTNRDSGLFARGEGETDEVALAAAFHEANVRTLELRDALRRANAGRRLAERVVAELKLATRWPCPECQREGPQTPLRTILRVPVDINARDREIGPRAYSGCVRCNDHDRLVALAEGVLGRLASVPEG